MKDEIALVIIYNHRYDENIEVLEKMYGERFSNIYHLMPSYNGKKDKVIPVRGNPHCFQDYIAQGLTTYFEEKYSHYFFVADDLILNPTINEKNFLDIFRIDDHTAFIPSLISLHERERFWHRIPEALRFNPQKNGLKTAMELPTYSEAHERFSKFGLSLEPLNFNQVFQPKRFTLKTLLSYKESRSYFEYLLRKLHSRVRNESYLLPYPLVGSYSDIIIIPRKDIRAVCRLCAAFAATQLFVELALPTAIVLTSDKIVQDQNLGHHGKALWEKEEYSELDKYEKKLSRLLINFPEDYLYYHPIKLSTWDTNL